MFSILHTYSIVLYIIVKGSFEHKSENHQGKNLFKSSTSSSVVVAFSSSISSSITNTSETYTNQLNFEANVNSKSHKIESICDILFLYSCHANCQSFLLVRLNFWLFF